MIKYIFITFILFTFNFANAEIVNKIEINGNNRVGDETIKVYGEIEINKDYSSNDINKVLKNLYSTDFFEEDIDINNGIMKISLKEYPVINSIQIEGEKAKKLQEGILKPSNSKKRALLLKHI